MKLARFSVNGQEHCGIVEGETIQKITGSYFSHYQFTGESYPLDQVTLKAPALPSKVVCIGVNYKDHAQEMKVELPEEPLMFLKPSTTVIGPAESIVYPAISQRVDYEGELAVVVKKMAKKISPQEAGKYILGYTCANDVTARDLQMKDGQWTRGKSFDTFLPLGPWIETELDPTNLEISTRLNQELRQQSNTNQMVFDVYQLVSKISQVMTLLPGDIIITGTPSGVGPMQPGDRVEVEIEGIGILANPVAT